LLLSARSPEPDRPNRIKALPVGGRIGRVSFQSRALFDALGVGPHIEEHTNPDINPQIDPLYVFACALSWREQSNTSAGWELVTCLRSSGETARLAAALLVQPKNVQALVWALVRPIDGSDRPSLPHEPRFQKAAIRGLP
jgi:hypothetical protein